LGPQPDSTGVTGKQELDQLWKNQTEAKGQKTDNAQVLKELASCQAPYQQCFLDTSCQTPIVSQEPRSTWATQETTYAHEFLDTTVPPVVLAEDPSGPSHPLSPQLLMDNGAGLPIVPQQGQLQPVQQPIFPAPMGSQGNHQEGGAAWQPGQAAQAPGNFQSRNLAPHNEAPITPADIQKAAASEQPSLKRRADGAPLGNQPEPKRHDGGGAACNSNQLSIGPTDPAPMSVSERLEKGLIATVASLTKEETNELLLWARRKNMKWREIHERFKFGRAESTLRVRYRDLVKSRPPKVPKFTERDVSYHLLFCFSYLHSDTRLHRAFAPSAKIAN